MELDKYGTIIVFNWILKKSLRFSRLYFAEIVKQIMKARPEFSWKKDQNGCTSLHLSCSKGHLEVTRELLRFDIDLSSIQDNEGRTPLHWAAIKGRLNIIDEILSMSLQSADI